MLITDLRVRLGLSRGDRALCGNWRDSFNQKDNSRKKGETHKHTKMFRKEIFRLDSGLRHSPIQVSRYMHNPHCLKTTEKRSGKNVR